MTTGDIKVIKYGGGTEVYNAEDRDASSVTVTMKPGEPVKMAGTGTNFVQPLSTGDPEVSTDRFVGIVARESTETATADSTVEVTRIIGGATILRGQATTTSNISTAAQLLALQGDWVTFDNTGSSGTNGIFTINEDEGSDPNVHGLLIMVGDIEKGSLDVLVHANATDSSPTV